MTTKYISHGTYGCVMKPAVPCKKDDKDNKNKVSKIFYKKENALDEYKFNAKIAKQIDPKGEFTVKELDYCDIALSKFPEVDQCQWDSSYLKQKIIKQIVYEYGGISLRDACVTIHPHALFSTFKPLFVGLVTLSKKGWIHCDIKPENMLFNVETRKTVFIDWGMLTNNKDVYIKNSKMFFSYPYYYYPPEFIMYFNEHNKKMGFNSIPPIDVLRNFKLFFGNQFVKDSLKNVSDKLYNTVYKVMVDDFVSYMSKPDLHIFDPSKIDVFALGISLIQMIVNESGIHRYSKKLKEDLLVLACKMCYLNPVKRMKPEDALEKFEKLYKRRLCAPRKIQNIVSGRCGLKSRQVYK